MSEHFLIRHARTLPFSAICPLQPILNQMFIGAIQGIGRSPNIYTMEAVTEAVEAHKKAIAIADGRQEQARKEKAA